MKVTARRATSLIAGHVNERGLELIDIKYEFGEVEGQTMIIDEVSGDSMRVARGGQILLQTELEEALLGEA
ncbi:MAG: phosphoribosylaminoimidazole-succinocarboxamide synthase [Firmicutes bacterium ADurb.BinA052]|nr:MAG: phosphoribosylaminoimidazole-succinocarboxamide synthase [Firmicutes bacterium ADurb.BinA052]